MEKTMRFDGNLDMFNNIVLLYKNDNGDTYLGASANMVKDNYIILYKNSLPKDTDYLSGWNYLDDHCEKTYLVYNDHSEVAVDDFLAAHNVDKTWKDLEYTVVDNTMKMNEILSNVQLSNNEVQAYATLKQ